MAVNACYGCTERFVGCHANCKKYAEWCVNHQKELEAKKKRDAVDDYFVEQSVKRQKVARRLKKLDFFAGGKRR